MILIFGGTTEGRVAAKVCNGASKPFYYSTKSKGQEIEAVNMLQLYGAMTYSNIIEFCKEKDIKLIIDASHPFADILHKSVMEAATELNIPIIRYERRETPNKEVGDVHYCNNLNEAIEYISQEGFKRVLALTGVKSSKELATIAKERDVFLRMMDREESWHVAKESGFPLKNIVIYAKESEKELIDRLSPQIIITKESGESGGVPKKIEVANDCNVKLVIIKRPQLPNYKNIVYSEHGLRIAIDKTLPGFFNLSSGLTTGSCATAAAVAALHSVITQQPCNITELILPSGERVYMDVIRNEFNSNSGSATVIKNGGDDPDVTHGAEISVNLKISNSSKEIVIKGGKGVGSVTLPGIGLEVGESAINCVPRQMIKENIYRELKKYKLECGVEAVVSVKDGEEIAKRTFNGRLGIVGGISILGTSGVVYPFSKEAFVESIEQHLKIVEALGCKSVVINSGGKSENFLKSHFTEINSEAFVQYGNMIGSSLELCVKANIPEVILGIMIGKAVKLAEGSLDTHSKVGTMNIEFITKIAQEANCSSNTIDKIKLIKTARQLWDIIPKSERLFFEAIKQYCYRTCQPLMKSSSLKIILVRDNGELV